MKYRSALERYFSFYIHAPIGVFVFLDYFTVYHATAIKKITILFPTRNNNNLNQEIHLELACQ